MRYCGYILGKKNFNHYLILGDDIVINDTPVALMYKKLIKGLGVEISSSKTHTSKYMYEFAKRWIHINHGEISGLPMRGIVENFENIYLTYQNLYAYFVQRKNIYLAKEGLLNSVADLVSQVNKRFHRRQNSKDLLNKVNPKLQRGVLKINRVYMSKKGLIERLTPLHLMLRYTSGTILYEELRLFLLKYSNIDMVPNDMEGALSLLKDYIEYSLLDISDGIIKKTEKFYSEIMYTKNDLNLDRYSFPEHPLFTNILNQVVKFDTIIKTIMNGTYDLSDVVKELTYIDPKVVLLSNKRVIKERVLLGNISRRILVTLKLKSFQTFVKGYKAKDLE